MTYATLAQAIPDLKAENDIDTALEVIDGKAYLIQALKFITSRIDEECQQEFEPRYHTYRIDASSQNVDWYENTLFLPQPLLVVDTVKVLDTELVEWNGVTYSEQAGKDYYVYPLDDTPYWALQGLTSSVWYPGTYNSAYPAGGKQAISVTGWWAYRQYCGQAWKSSGDTVTGSAINATVTSITVTNADGPTYDGTTPRFSPGNLIRIGTEYISVENVDYVTNILTVERGVRGTTAAAHDASTAIDVWIPDANINRAALRWAGYLYQRRGIYEAVRQSIDGQYTVQFPQDVPEEVRGILFPKYQNTRIRAV